MRNYAIITTDRGRRGSRRTMATGAATTMDNNNHILYWKLYEGISSIISIRICFCMCICICYWVCLLFVDERIVRAFLYSPFAIRLFNVVQYVVIADVPAEYVAQSQCPRSHFHFRTQPNNDSPPTRELVERKKKWVGELVWYLSLKWINSMGPSPIWFHYLVA